MATFYTIDTANERLPEIQAALLVLRDQRRELIRLRDRYLELTGSEIDEARRPRYPEVEAADDPRSTAEAATITGLEEAELIGLRVRGIVDQMGAFVARLDRWGIALRDIENGLIDFPALAGGRQVWLCWRIGDPDEIAWWHEHDAGFSGRRPLAEIG